MDTSTHTEYKRFRDLMGDVPTKIPNPYLPGYQEHMRGLAKGKLNSHQGETASPFYTFKAGYSTTCGLDTPYYATRFGDKIY